MPFAWMLNVVWIALAVIVFVIFLSRLLRTPLPFGLIGSMALTLMVSQGLLFWLNSDTLPALNNAQRNAWLAITFLLGLSTILRAVKWILLELLVHRRSVKIPPFLLDISEWFVMLLAILLTIRLVFGVELTGLLVTSTVASAIIGLALQDTLGNFISGISLQVEAPFAADDWVEIDGIEGIISGKTGAR